MESPENGSTWKMIGELAGTPPLPSPGRHMGPRGVEHPELARAPVDHDDPPVTLYRRIACIRKHVGIPALPPADRDDRLRPDPPTQPRALRGACVVDHRDPARGRDADRMGDGRRDPHTEDCCEHDCGGHRAGARPVRPEDRHDSPLQLRARAPGHGERQNQRTRAHAPGYGKQVRCVFRRTGAECKHLLVTGFLARGCGEPRGHLGEGVEPVERKRGPHHELPEGVAAPRMDHFVRQDGLSWPGRRVQAGHGIRLG